MLLQKSLHDEKHDKKSKNIMLADAILQENVDSIMEEIKPKLIEDMDSLELSQDERDEYIQGVKKKLQLESIRIFKEKMKEKQEERSHQAFEAKQSH